MSSPVLQLFFSANLLHYLVWRGSSHRLAVGSNFYCGSLEKVHLYCSVPEYYGSVACVLCPRLPSLCGLRGPETNDPTPSHAVNVNKELLATECNRLL